MLLPHGTVVALVDAKKFQLFRNNGTESEPELVEAPAPKLDAHNHSGVSHHSRPGNHADASVDEDAHAIAAVEWLNGQVLDHKIAHLVVIASPRTMGELRKHYHKQLEAVLVGELAKDLTGSKGGEIVAALRGK